MTPRRRTSRSARAGGTRTPATPGTPVNPGIPATPGTPANPGIPATPATSPTPPTPPDQTVEKVAIWAPTIAGLIGALVGAIAGFGGSYLLYLQGQAADVSSSADRLADIRRNAYGDFVGQSQAVRNDIILFNNQVASKKSESELYSTYAKVIAPDLTKYAKSRTVVALIGTPSVTAAADSMGDARDRLTELVNAQMQYKEGSNQFGSAYSADDFQVRLFEYDKDVRKFVAEARAEVL